MKKFGFILVVLAVFFSGSLALAQAPQILNFQGQLNDSSGQPVADGNYSVQFLIYTTASGGSPVWSQTQTVTTKGGVFNVLLSNVNLDLSASAYYLAMKVGSDAEMTPRQRIASVPYALQANPWMQNGKHVYFNNISGNVGIGIENPLLDFSMGFFGLQKGNASPNAGFLRFGDNTGWKFHIGRIRESSGGPINTGQQGVLMTVQDNGWIGIGTDAPRKILNVKGSGWVEAAIDSDSYGASLFLKNSQREFAIGSRENSLHIRDITAGDKLRIQLDSTGKLNVYGTLYVSGADFAEPFDMTDIETLELGDVVVIDPQNPLHVMKSSQAYDSTVAGIVSSNEQAGYIAGGRSDGSSDKPVALVGRVLCKVSAENGPIQLGDLLTTSSLPGHAMKATDFERRQGAILGKALQTFDGEAGTIMVLVTLQ